MPARIQERNPETVAILQKYMELKNISSYGALAKAWKMKHSSLLDKLHNKLSLMEKALLKEMIDALECERSE